MIRRKGAFPKSKRDKEGKDRTRHDPDSHGVVPIHDEGSDEIVIYIFETL